MLRPLRAWKVGIQTASRILDLVASTGIVTIVILVVTNVYMRWSNNSLAGVIGLSELVLAIAVACGLPWALMEGAHVATGLVVDRMRPDRRRLAIRTGHLAGAIITVWFTYATLLRALTSVRSNEVRFGQVPIPVWPGRLSLTIGMGLMAVALLYITFAEDVRSGSDKVEPEMSGDNMVQS